MKHVFKFGGERETVSGTPYSIEAINDDRVNEYLNNGWHLNIEDIECIEAEFTEVKESGSEHEASLRANTKALGGSPAGRSSIKTLESQLAKLESENEQD